MSRTASYAAGRSPRQNHKCAISSALARSDERPVLRRYAGVRQRRAWVFLCAIRGDSDGIYAEASGERKAIEFQWIRSVVSNDGPKTAFASISSSPPSEQGRSR
jgi:hypothetical protein